MDRTIIYSTEQGRAFDFLTFQRIALQAQSEVIQSVLGGTTAVISGLTAAETAPASLIVNISKGSIFQSAVLDPTPYGTLPATALTYFLQGLIAAQPLTFSTAGMSGGQKRWALVQAKVNFSDVVAPGDPNNGILPYFNPQDPTHPLQGPGGSGAVQPSMRLCTGTLSIKYGTVAAAGSEVPPAADAGFVGIYLVDLAQGQTQILTSQVLVAGPSVGPNVPGNYPRAPYLAGLLNQHHRGFPGQAPKIDLTTEVQGVLPLANLPGTNTIGLLPTIRRGAGVPSGTVAGNIDDLYFDTTGNNLYVCTTAGSAGTAVWTIAVTTAGATPTGAAGGDLGGSYPNPAVAKTRGLAWKAAQTLVVGQMLFVDGTPEIKPVIPSGDIAASTSTIGLLKTVGIQGVPVSANAPADRSVLQFVNANSDLEFLVPENTLIQEDSAGNPGSDLAVTDTFQTALSVQVTFPAASGKYRVMLDWNMFITMPQAADPRGISAQLTDGVTVFGYANGVLASGSILIANEGIGGHATSPSYNPGDVKTFQLQIKMSTGLGGVLVKNVVQTFLNSFVVRSVA